MSFSSIPVICSFQDCWRPYLGFLAPDSSSAEPHLQVLVAAADGGNRRKFTIIDRESMLQSVCISTA